MFDIEPDLALIRANGHEVELDEPASEESILVLEDAIGFQLPASIRTFLSRYGTILIYDNCISGISENQPLEKVGGNLYADTLFLRESYPETPDYLYVIMKHEDGAYCIDTRRRTVGDEFAISNAEGGVDHGIVAKTFTEFITDWFLATWVKDRGEEGS